MSGIKDLRDFLAVLKGSKLLFEAEQAVGWKYETGSLLATLEAESRRTGLFHNIKDKEFSVCGNALASMDSITLVLGCRKDEMTDFLTDYLGHPMRPQVVAGAPYHENIRVGDEVDLEHIPIPIHIPKDDGPIITSGVIVSKEMDGTRQNLSFQKMHVKGKDKFNIMINKQRHLEDFYDQVESQRGALLIAVVIGADPVIYVGAGLRYDGGEAEIASAIRESPIEVAKCITSSIYVPATAEFAIEGEILPDCREKEGPLGEFMGHYNEPWNSPMVQVKAITHRNRAIYQTINGASFEHINLGNVLPRGPPLKTHTQYASKGVTSIHAPLYGSGFLAIVQMKKKNPGEPKNVALAAMTAYVNIKNVIVVDEDVDIYSPTDVMWTVSNRVIPERNIFYAHSIQGHKLDPCSGKRGVQTKIGIDTILNGESRYLERVHYPKMDLKGYQ